MSFVQVPAAQKAHSQQLAIQIRAAIQQNGGWIGFDDYMQRALYTPVFGYYAGGSIKFGEAGDFITAPELGNLFGRCLATQAQEVLSQLAGGLILEFGAGSGALAASMLIQLSELGTLPAEYLILEVSSELRARQRETLLRETPEQLARVRWLDSLPEQFEGVIIANEVLDAMPVKVFEQDQTGSVYELGVANASDAKMDRDFYWQRQPAKQPLIEAVQSLELTLDSGVFQSEMHFQAQAWIKSLADMMRKGVVLMIDYGFPQAEYYHPDRNAGTIMCHFRHHAHDDPFYLPGLQDITAHVDFSAIATTAKHAGFELLGYATQAAFLLSAGLLDKIALNLPVQAQLTLAQEVKKLTLPHEMGELFKVMALSKNFPSLISGFSQQNNSHRLFT